MTAHSIKHQSTEEELRAPQEQFVQFHFTIATRHCDKLQKLLDERKISKEQSPIDNLANFFIENDVTLNEAQKDGTHTKFSGVIESSKAPTAIGQLKSMLIVSQVKSRDIREK